jgi:hypothetical protein
MTEDHDPGALLRREATFGAALRWRAGLVRPLALGLVRGVMWPPDELECEFL